MSSLGPGYTMDREVGPWKMAFFNGPTSMVQLIKKISFESLGSSHYVPLLHLSLQNPLDHVNAFIMPWNVYFGDLDLHGHSDIFSLV